MTAMRTALRKMGNSTGMIVPKAILGQLGVASGTAMDVSVEGNRIVATPVETMRRAGWAEAAEVIGNVPDAGAADWLDLGLDGDAHLTW
jgi:antitoxin MazE